MTNQPTGGIAPVGGNAAPPELVESTDTFAPFTDVIDAEQEMVFVVDLPGVKAGDVDVTYDEGILNVRGRVRRRQPDGTRFVREEYGVGDFERAFRVGTEIDPDGIRAEVKNGELRLRVPKAATARVRRIPVRTS